MKLLLYYHVFSLLSVVFVNFFPFLEQSQKIYVDDMDVYDIDSVLRNGSIIYTPEDDYDEEDEEGWNSLNDYFNK